MTPETDFCQRAFAALSIDGRIHRLLKIHSKVIKGLYLPLFLGLRVGKTLRRRRHSWSQAFRRRRQ